LFSCSANNSDDALAHTIQVHSKSNQSHFGPFGGSQDRIASLRATGDRLHVLAAAALTTSNTEAERLRQRIAQLEAIARLNGETIRNMQQAAAGIATAEWRRDRG
jgi:ABC-type uncharacterized transport system fused permease/ATPase subunit